MKITILGTCSGTEPMKDRRYTSVAVEHGGRVYWLDAGEGCSHTAYVNGMDLPATAAIFISHTHMDHIGGLPSLLWTLRKLNNRSPANPRPLMDKTLKVFIPQLDIWDAAVRLCSGPKADLGLAFNIEAETYLDGVIYRDGDFELTALHNMHLGAPCRGQPWRSFSFRIRAGGKVVVYSGDVAGIDDLEPLIDGCDLLLMEAAHQDVSEVCRYLADSGHSFGRLVFIHHGRAVLEDPAGELRKAKRILGDCVCLAVDGMSMVL